MTQKNRHPGTIPQLCRAISSQLRHVSTFGKKLVKQQYLLHMSPQYVELWPTSGWDRFTSLGHRIQRLPLLHGSHVVSVSHTLRCWTQGGTYVRQGDHHVGHWPTFLVLFCFCPIGSRPSDHYFRSVCLFVQFFSAVFDPISIKLGHVLYVWF